VRHTQFGDGTVSAQTETLVTVEFENGKIVKKFIYPAVFEQFLTLVSVEQQEKIENELKQLHELEEAKRKELREKEAELQKNREKELKLQHDQKKSAGKKHPAVKRRDSEQEDTEAAETEYGEDSDE
jgi:uncharacterized membrane protein